MAWSQGWSGWAVQLWMGVMDGTGEGGGFTGDSAQTTVWEGGSRGVCTSARSSASSFQILSVSCQSSSSSDREA